MSKKVTHIQGKHSVQYSEKDKVINELKRIRNIGPAIADKLYRVGIRSAEEIIDGEPEEIYMRLQEMLGQDLDRCVLYVLRGAKADIPWPLCSDKNLGMGHYQKGGS